MTDTNEDLIAYSDEEENNETKKKPENADQLKKYDNIPFTIQMLTLSQF